MIYFICFLMSFTHGGLKSYHITDMNQNGKFSIHFMFSNIGTEQKPYFVLKITMVIKVHFHFTIPTRIPGFPFNPSHWSRRVPAKILTWDSQGISPLFKFDFENSPQNPNKNPEKCQQYSHRIRTKLPQDSYVIFKGFSQDVHKNSRISTGFPNIFNSRYFQNFCIVLTQFTQCSHCKPRIHTRVQRLPFYHSHFTIDTGTQRSILISYNGSIPFGIIPLCRSFDIVYF